MHRKNLLFLLILFEIAAASFSVCAASAVSQDEIVLIKEDFKQLVPMHIRKEEIARMKSSGFPVENTQKMVHPENWFISTWGMPRDLTLTASNEGWHVSTEKTVLIFPPFIRNDFADFFLNMTICGGMRPSTVSVSVAHVGMLYGGDERLLQKIEIAAGEKRTVQLPIHFDFVNNSFRICFKISGDVSLQNMLLSGRFLDMSEKGFSCVEGTLEACSAIPDPKKSDYPDCRFTCHFMGKCITAGCPCPRELQLVLDGFRNYRLLGTKNLKAGDKVRCIILPYEKLPENRKSTQQADDLDLISLDSYYVARIEKIVDFSASDIIPFTQTEEKYISVFERNFNPPVSAELDKMQQDAIAADLTKINAMLEGWDREKIKQTNEAFQKAWAAEKAKDKPGYNRVKVGGQTYVWRNVENSFWALPENYLFCYGYTSLNPKNLEALVALRDFLHANGCQFIVSLVPHLYDISARIMNPDSRHIPDFLSAFTAQELLKNGIETIYHSDELIKNYNRCPLAFDYPHDVHPSDTCQNVAAELVAEKIRRYGFARELDPDKFSTVLSDYWRKDETSRWPSACDIGNNQPGTPYLCHRVLYDGKPIRPVSKSPILVIGNSFIQTPAPMPEAFPALLASKLFVGISAKRVNADGPLLVIPHNLMKDPEGYLKGKKVVLRRFVKNGR